MSGAAEKTANPEIAIGLGALRWWDPLLVPVLALVGWFVVVGGPALHFGGSLPDFADPAYGYYFGTCRKPRTLLCSLFLC